MSFYRYIRVKWIVIDDLYTSFSYCAGAPHMWCGGLTLCVRMLNTTQVYGKDKGNLSSRSVQKLSDWYEFLCD